MKFILNRYIRKEEGSQINKFPPQKNQKKKSKIEPKQAERRK